MVLQCIDRIINSVNRQGLGLHKQYGNENEDNGIKLIHTEIILITIICDAKIEEISCS